MLSLTPVCAGMNPIDESFPGQIDDFRFDKGIVASELLEKGLGIPDVHCGVPDKLSLFLRALHQSSGVRGLRPAEVPAIRYTARSAAAISLSANFIRLCPRYRYNESINPLSSSSLT